MPDEPLKRYTLPLIVVALLVVPSWDRLSRLMRYHPGPSDDWVATLDWMRDYLKGERDALPPSQVVRPQPRGLELYTEEDVDGPLLPAVQQNPAPGDRIKFANRVLSIPK